jgi:hypothetical protein
MNKPHKNPTISPSFLPLINPKEDVTTRRRFGEIPPKASHWKKVHWSRKLINIMRKTTIFLANLSPPFFL